jgi:2-polyprenyl-3-methyl-5-hydroxy-6-metoxy-1,4-benzoquinol methylase
VRCTVEMLPSIDVIRADFDRIATCSREQPQHIERVAQRLVPLVPLRSRVLEIGCGTGALARELAAKRGAKVTAIDLSPRMIDVARVRTPASLGIEYCVADFLALSPSGFDVVIAVNTLHHVPLADAAARMADAVVVGGHVLIADLVSEPGLLALPYNLLSWIAQGPRAVSPELVAAWNAHGTHDAIQTYSDVRRVLRRALPGVATRRHLGWRYSASWQRR